MAPEPYATDEIARKPTDVTIIEHVPPEMTCQPYAIASNQGVQDRIVLPDTSPQQKKGQTAMKERIAMPTNAQERDIPIGKDRAKVTRHEGQAEEANSPEGTLVFVCTYRNVRH